ncbi:AraC family transcriptional regulator [Taibaiella sp. KBW10]|uniref:AraC family transcriptional regulator n=1 Tax=Taibaiella sp. KBW10 TaxID=2153357 RepID=UPI000F5B1292|nr:AraC family transcriptional regulator [Taibaiella sp. KBW10]RQO32055.1 AraC family transcriptional regulator [Taibaiella sp. KBW10]
MTQQRILLHTPDLRSEANMHTLVEHSTTYTMRDCEFSIYETHQVAKDIKLQFNNLAFTAMLRGKKVMKLDNKSAYFEYLPGESVLVAPGETMVIDFPESDAQPSQCIALSLSPEFVAQTLQYLNLREAKIEEQSSWKIDQEDFYLFNSTALASATNNIMRIAMEDNLQKDIMADFALKELLVRLMQTQARKLVENNQERKQSTSRLAFVIEYIKNNLHQKLSIDNIAKLAYVSKSNFFKLFKQELGISPNEYILQERIARAKNLLRYNNSIKEVAYQTGFADTNYFTKTFKHFEGITPKNYQNAYLMVS